jgi:peptidoglycan/xylan/chitin deacetylase (PgdA/CDA1 family)
VITHAEFPAWPDGADVAVALTFDVDGETPWRGEGPEYSRRLTVLSQGRFGPERGLHRVLALLAEHQIPGTFYIPGYTVDEFPEVITAIAGGEHEFAHHGYMHLGTEGLDESAQRAELERGLAAFERHGIRPIGYRSPGWELTPETLSMLTEFGFSYDSSLMADDRPYWEVSGSGPLLELPGHWSLCDWPFFGFTPYHGGLLACQDRVERIWLEEYESALADRRVLTLTMHPEAIGRGYLTRMLDRVITGMRERGRPWFATHAQIAALASAPAQAAAGHRG